jgi:hypothetical protein
MVLGAVDHERILTYVRFRHPLTNGVRSEEGSLSSQPGWHSHVVGMNFLTYYSTRYPAVSFTPFRQFSRRVPSSPYI